MADDAYSYVLVVEFGENGNTKLKNKLVKYFQSKKSNGGDCKIQYVSPQKTAMLRFRTEEARQNVLEKKTHEVVWEERVLKLTVRLPSEQGTPVDRGMKSDLSVSADVPATDETHGGSRAPETGIKRKAVGTEDPTVDEEPCSCSAVLGNIPKDMDREFLALLVETISSRSSCPAVKDIPLEILPDTCSAVVTFHSGKENSAFIASCPKNSAFKNKGISVRSLEVTTKVRIEDISNVGYDHLQLYFDKPDMEVKSLVLNEEEQCAILTFANPKDVHRVIEKKHFIRKKPIKVFPFYESLGMALYGEDRPTLKLPAAFSESIDPAICRCLQDKHEVAEKFHKDLEKHFCKVDFQQSAVCLSPLPSLLQQKGVKPKDITDWACAVKTAFAQALSKFKSLQFQVQSSAWEESEREIREALLTEAVVVVADEDKGALSVAGLGDDVNRLKTSLLDKLNGIAKRVQREKSSITDEMNLLPSTYHILFQDGLLDKISQEYPELNMSYNKERQTFVSSGLAEEVRVATSKMMNGVLALKRQMLEVDDFVLEFLKREDQERLSSLLTSKGIHAALEISGKSVQLLAVSDNVVNDAKDELKNLLISQYIHVEDDSILKMSEWRDLVTSLEDATNKVQIQISATVSGQKVVVSGYKDDVESIHNQLKDFLQQNGKVEEVIVVKPDTIVKYIEQQKRHAWLTQVKDGVVVSFNDETICLSGSRANVTAHKDLIDDVVSSVVLDTLKVSKPGAKKFFQDQETTYVSSAMANTGCLVQLVDELDLYCGPLDQAQDMSFVPNIPKPTYQFKTIDGVEVAVCKADLCSYPVDAVVNASNEDLDHGAGLAAALVKAAGPQLQKELDKIKIREGRLKPGDCAVTGAGGQLSCKQIIHAVGPQFNRANQRKAVGQLSRAVKRSLELAEMHGCPSVALPAISRNLGFPLNLCADTIVKAVKDHCDDRYGENTLKRIHLVDGEDGAVQAMEAAVRKVFGNQGISHSQQKHPTDTTQSRHVRTVQKQANSDQVLTQEGLCITLKEGNIQDATTHVVVNTVGENLMLNTGAVSKAILGAAGKKLQDLILKKNTVGKAGDVIITDGCQLKCDKVFHTIAPQWDKGQGAAQKMLSGIVKRCLKLAEDGGLASMTFPAIGTGNLAFPKDLVASLLLGEVLKFSSNKQPKTLREVVFILHPSDAQTIQAFRDEFTKRFAASDDSAPTTATQSKGQFSKITSSSGMHETQMGNVVIQVAVGDITTETSDVIVNSSNETFTLKTGVSKAILDAAGQSVEIECQQLGSEPNPGMILTKPGNLKCQSILHLHLHQNDPSGITKVVTDALEMCLERSYTSVSFPAIGTGQGSSTASQAADAMLDAVVNVLGQNAQSPLKTVRIIIFQPAMLNDFYSSMQKKEDVNLQHATGIWGKIKSYFTGGSATDSKPPKNQAFVIVSHKVDPACFHICGDTRAKVDSAKKWICDLLQQQQGRKDFTDSAILSLNDSDRQRIVDIQATMNVRIEYNQHRALLSVEGLHMDVHNATTEIEDMLLRAREEEQFRKDVELAGSVADWQFGKDGLQFQSFDPVCNYQLEEGLKKNQPFVEVFMQGQVYKVELPMGPGIDDQGNSYKVNRIDKLAMLTLPTTWEDMPANTLFKSFPVLPGSAEYNGVLSQFQASSKGTVVKIERIQNPSMWQSLQVKKQDMEGRNLHNNNEKLLFHGTCQTNVDRINNSGFNRNFDAHKDDGGKGTRFTVNAATSETYSIADAQGQKCMYLCHVLTGDYTQRQPDMIAPPAKTSNANHLYDSVVDDTTTPNMFMVFHDQMAYPEYLITFN